MNLLKRNRELPGGAVLPTGNLSAVKISTALGELTVEDIVHYAYPHNGLSDQIRDYRETNIENINRGLAKIILADKYRIPTFYGLVWAKVFRGNGEIEDYGIISTRVVTTAGVNFIVDAFQNSVEVENLKFHGIGTGNTAEAAGDTALVTELTTEYNPNSTRATGSTTEGGSANIYRTVGTNTIDSGTPAIVEHGIFSQAATGGGTLLDRSVFSAINLVGANGDGLQTTYDLTFSSGG